MYILQKPRTVIGWMGPLYHPNPSACPDIENGIRYTREMMINVIDRGLPLADEILFIHSSKALLDLVSWVAVGARSNEDTEHRIFASAIDFPVGMKNPTHGSLLTLIESIVIAQSSQVSSFEDYQISTNGNPHAHIVLRGSKSGPNFNIEHLKEIQKLIKKNSIKNPSILIDASHDNCVVDGKKDYRLQCQVINSVINNMNHFPKFKNLVKVISILKVFSKEGNQKDDINTPVDIDSVFQLQTVVSVGNLLKSCY